MSLSDSNQWTLFRVKANSGTAGNFGDDTDYAGTNTAPAADALIDVPKRIGETDVRTTGAEIVVLALAADGSLVNRSTFTFSVQLVEVAPLVGNPVAYVGASTGVIDQASIASATANRVVRLVLQRGRYAIRLHTFANIPGTANELRIYGRLT